MVFKMTLILLFKNQNKNGLQQTVLFWGTEELNVMQVNQASLDLAQDVISADMEIFNDASFHCFKYIYIKKLLKYNVL